MALSRVALNWVALNWVALNWVALNWVVTGDASSRPPYPLPMGVAFQPISVPPTPAANQVHRTIKAREARFPIPPTRFRTNADVVIVGTGWW